MEFFFISLKNRFWNNIKSYRLNFPEKGSSWGRRSAIQFVEGNIIQ